jgi:uncharacterized protein YbbK (DUF523 family)
MKKHKPENVVIEVGGIPSDLEHSPLAGAFRMLGINSLVMPELVMLSYFEHVDVEGQTRLKAQIIKEGLRTTMERYAGLPLKAAFVRRNHIPQEISNERLQTELERIAYETQTDPQKFFFLDNVQNLDEEKNVVERAGVFMEQDKPPMVSACIAGAPCRFNGISSPLGRDRNVLLSNGQALLLCPEVLAGLPIPRGPYQIVGGDGEDVLNGIAQVVDGTGVNVSEQFIEGAIRTLKALLAVGSKKAILREQSPSCATNRLRALDSELKDGSGVTTALLKRWGIECISSDTI